MLVLAGEDGRVLAEHAAQVEREPAHHPGIGAVTSTASLVRPELIVRPDFARAADLGVTTAIADTLRIATNGDYDQACPKINLPSARCRSWCAADDAARAPTSSLLARLPVPGARGPVPLSNVATLAVTPARPRSPATTGCATSTSRSS